MTDSDTAPEDPRRRKLRLCLIAASVLYPASLIPWFVVYTIVLMGGIALPLYIALPYPLVVLGSLIAGWIFYAKHRGRAAWWSLALPLLEILVFALVMAWLILAAKFSQG